MFFPVIVLDIDNQGLEFIHAADSEISVFHNKAFHHVGWLKNDVPYLIMPLEKSPDNTTVMCAKNVEEIFFGVDEVIPTNARFLQFFDANKDQRFDAYDTPYEYGYLWFDRNKDGICTPDEVMPLSAFGITINLDFERVFEQLEGYHTLNYRFTFSVDYVDKDGNHIQRDGLQGYDIALHAIPYHY